jgi:hypothetical protein
MRATTATTDSWTATALRDLVSASSLPRVTRRQADAPRWHLVSLLLALTLVATRAGVVAAHSGDLDPSFGTGGTVTSAAARRSAAPAKP